MAQKQYFAIIDTETTIDDTVADIGIVIVDRQGNIYNQMAVLVKDHFDSKELFYRKGEKFWSFEYAQKKKALYTDMLNSGSRMMASVSAVNMWIQKAIGKYNPILTAYNLSFDVTKSANTGIDLNGFTNRFCLWHAAASIICGTKEYKRFVLENHLFNRPTEKGNMTYKTDAETVCGFLQGNLVDEPHTAIEDAINFELPILTHILKKKKWQDKVSAYNWANFQVKNHFKV